MSQVIIENAYEGTTSTLQYIGNPNDIVLVSAIYNFAASQPIRDVSVGLFKGFRISSVKDNSISDFINSVPINAAKSYRASKSGILNIVLHTQSMPVGGSIEAVCEVTN